MKKIIFLLLLLCSISASAQDTEALYQAGKKLYDNEKYTEAYTKLKPAADGGHKKAQYRLGRMYAKGKGVDKDHSKAAYWYGKAAASGHAKSQYRLGKCYMKGKGVKEDRAKAKELILKAVNNKKNGKDILYDIRQDAKSGDSDAKAILSLIGKN